ncbi:MAG: hypothetical protein ACR2PL_04275, partial [Dehalococcoidia bacterium]
GYNDGRGNTTMATVELSPATLTVHVEGMDKLWALRSRLDIPLEHVTGAEPNGEMARKGLSGFWTAGFRVPGTHLPGVLTAGSFYQPREGEFRGWTFWDVHDPEKAIVINLGHEHYQRLVIGVDDPRTTVTAIQQAIEHREK